MAFASPVNENDIDNNIYRYVYEERPRKLDNNVIRSQTQQVEVMKESPSSSNAAITNQDRIKSIAYNSREVRLVGPDQKEVEMKDDVATKIVTALENLQKEATDVWDQVNDQVKTFIQKNF